MPEYRRTSGIRDDFSFSSCALDKSRLIAKHNMYLGGHQKNTDTICISEMGNYSPSAIASHCSMIEAPKSKRTRQTECCEMHLPKSSELSDVQSISPSTIVSHSNARGLFASTGLWARADHYLTCSTPVLLILFCVYVLTQWNFLVDAPANGIDSSRQFLTAAVALLLAAALLASRLVSQPL